MRPSGRYKSAAAVAASDVPKQTFNRWLDRKVIGLAPEDIPGDGRGKPRKFGTRTIKKLAIAHKISLLGIPADKAVKLASRFADEPQRGRPIGELFESGRTILVATLDGPGDIHCIPPDGNIESLLNSEAAIVVDISAIISTLNLRLAVIQ